MECGILSDRGSIMMVLLVRMPRGSMDSVLVIGRVGSVLVVMRLHFISDLMCEASVIGVSWVRWNDDSWGIFIHKTAQRSEEVVLLLSRSRPVKFLLKLLHILVGCQVLLGLDTIQNAGSGENVLNHRQSIY